MLSPEQIAAIRERESKATRGPWTLFPEIDNIIEDEDGYAICSIQEHGSMKSEMEGEDFSHDDGYFIQESRTDIPALLDHIEELEAVVLQLRERLDRERRKNG